MNPCPLFLSCLGPLVSPQPKPFSLAQGPPSQPKSPPRGSEEGAAQPLGWSWGKALISSLLFPAVAPGQEQQPEGQSLLLTPVQPSLGVVTLWITECTPDPKQFERKSTDFCSAAEFELMDILWMNMDHNKSLALGAASSTEPRGAALTQHLWEMLPPSRAPTGLRVTPLLLSLKARCEGNLQSLPSATASAPQVMEKSEPSPGQTGQGALGCVALDGII